MARDVQVVKDFYGKIIGSIEILDNGDKVIKDFYGKILGKYSKKFNITKDFYGRIIARGDQAALLFNYKK